MNDYLSHIILSRQSQVYQQLDSLAAHAKVVCFSGLPAVGKSLYVQQFSYMALAKGRSITTLQWDLARQSFETPQLLLKYPEKDGITHAGIRKACGLWARGAVHNWILNNKPTKDVLVVESPLIGNRLVELVAPQEDGCEHLFRGDDVNFVVPIPTQEVRLIIESRRKQSSVLPSHDNEKADASPHVMMILYKELFDVAIKLGYQRPVKGYQYDPAVYEFVYRQVLKFRNMVPLHIVELVEPKESVYSFESERKQLAPTSQEVSFFENIVANRFEGNGNLQEAVDSWFKF